MKLKCRRFSIATIAAIGILLSPILNAAYAQSTIQKLFGITEPRTQDVTPYWSEGLNTLLEIYCTDLRCNADPAHTDDAYVFTLNDVKIPTSEIGAGNTKTEILVKSVRASIAKNGLMSFNGFPEKIDLSIEGITLNDDGIKELAAILSQNDKRLQRLIARELAKESIQLTASLERHENIFELKAEISLLSGDTIGLGLSAVTPAKVLEYLTKDQITAKDLAELEEPALRGAMLFDSVAWERLQTLSIQNATFQLQEVKLLDKIYAPILLKKKSSGEKLFWANVREIADPFAAALQRTTRFKGSKEDISGAIDFYANWRSKNGSLTGSIQANNVDKLISDIDRNGFDPKNIDNCNMAAVLIPSVLVGAGAALPYLTVVEQLINDVDSSENTKNIIKEASDNADIFVNEILKTVQCNTGVISISYKKGN